MLGGIADLGNRERVAGVPRHGLERDAEAPVPENSDCLHLLCSSS